MASQYLQRSTRGYTPRAHRKSIPYHKEKLARVVIGYDVAHVVGARIRELRCDAEMTLDELARRVGTHRPIMTRIELGWHTPDLRTAAKIAAALSIDVATLLVCLDDEWRCLG